MSAPPNHGDTSFTAARGARPDAERKRLSTWLRDTFSLEGVRPLPAQAVVLPLNHLGPALPSTRVSILSCI